MKDVMLELPFEVDHFVNWCSICTTRRLSFSNIHSYVLGLRHDDTHGLREVFRYSETNQWRTTDS